MGRLLITLGLSFIALGVLVIVWSRLGLPGFTKLPGDIIYRGKNMVVYFPVVTCLLVSLVLTLALTLIREVR